MNITLLANRDLAANYALNLLVPVLSKKHRLRIFLSDRVGGREGGPADLEELKFFEQTLWNEILFPALDRGGLQGELLSFKGLGRLVGHEVEVLNRINRRRSRERLEEAAPDLIISIRYGSILRDRVIAIPTHGVLNLHSGLLPAYRGVMATFRALLAGDEELGTTLHRIEDPGIDTGAILGTHRIPARKDRSYLWHVLTLYPGGCDLISDAVARMTAGEVLTGRPQEGGNYYGFPTDRELRAFRRAGHRLVLASEIPTFARRYLDAGLPDPGTLETGSEEESPGASSDLDLS